MTDSEFIPLRADESAEINGGYAFMAILAGTVLLVAKECVTHYKEFEAGFIAGYRAAR